MSKTRLVGIVNITPDSFSDGGKALRPDDALAAIQQLIADGADIIDIGAESTRPGATPLTAEEEWQRLEPVLALLPRESSVEFSLDTRHPYTARKALAHVDWINDVSGFADNAMIDAVKNSQCKLVVMHSLSVPADKNIVMPESADVIEELIAFAKQRISALEAAGIAHGRIVFDPGIGFGKTAKQSLDILHNIESFSVLGVPLYIGHSRKSFLGGNPAERDAATLAISRDLAAHGIAYLRVHDVAAHARVLKEFTHE